MLSSHRCLRQNFVLHAPDPAKKGNMGAQNARIGPGRVGEYRLLYVLQRVLLGKGMNKSITYVGRHEQSKSSTTTPVFVLLFVLWRRLCPSASRRKPTRSWRVASLVSCIYHTLRPCYDRYVQEFASMTKRALKTSVSQRTCSNIASYGHLHVLVLL